MTAARALVWIAVSTSVGVLLLNCGSEPIAPNSAAGSTSGGGIGGSSSAVSGGGMVGSSSGGSGAGGSDAGGTCCVADSDCGASQICIWGVCKDHDPKKGCWDLDSFDDTCGIDMDCCGAFVCPCGEICNQPDTPGFCEPSGASSCPIDVPVAGEPCWLSPCNPSGNVCTYPDQPTSCGSQTVQAACVSDTWVIVTACDCYAIGAEDVCEATIGCAWLGSDCFEDAPGSCAPFDGCLLDAPNCPAGWTCEALQTFPCESAAPQCSCGAKLSYCVPDAP